MTLTGKWSGTLAFSRDGTTRRFRPTRGALTVTADFSGTHDCLLSST